MLRLLRRGSVLAMVFAANQLAAQSPNSALKDSLEKLERASWVAWQHRDSAFFGRFLSADHVEIGVGGPAGKARVVAGVGSPACVVSSYAVDRFNLTQFNENTAVLTYHAEQHTTCGGTAVPSPVWVSSLFIRRGGVWENAVYQQTLDGTKK